MKQRVLHILFVLFTAVMSVGCAENGDTFILDQDTGLGYNIYINHKYGYCFSYPTFLKTTSFGFNSDKKKFVSKDAKIKAVASARFNHSHRSTSSLLNEEKYFLMRDGYSVTYEFSKEGIVVLSGFTPEGKIYYNKIAICDIYSPKYGGVRSVIARVDLVFEDDDRYRGEEVTELLKKFPYDKRF